MVGTSARRWTFGLLLLVAAACALVSARQVAASVAAPSPHRAVVVIDDGVSRRAHCIRFQGEISGIEALDATREPTVKAGFGGMGAAVCSIGGTGCSASQCLTCQAPKYWRYYRAEDGATSFRPSGGGASTAVVGDGDVDAWIWGNSAAAGAVPTVDSVCGARPTTTTSPPAPPPPGPDRPGPDAPVPTAPAPTGAALPPGAPTPAPTAPVLPATPTTGSTSTTGPGVDGREGSGAPAEEDGAGEGSGATADADPDLTVVDAEEELAAGPEPAGPSDAGSGGWWGVVAVGVLLAGIATWATLLRRRSSP
jgi:hypothetical protein